jgi:hypothetical protein
MKRLELSETDMELLKRMMWYAWHVICVEIEPNNGFPRRTIEEYIQIWKLNQKVHGFSVLKPTDVARVKRLYGKSWRGEQSWQQEKKVD